MDYDMPISEKVHSQVLKVAQCRSTISTNLPTSDGGIEAGLNGRTFEPLDCTARSDLGVLAPQTFRALLIKGECCALILR
ncbi:hypothetical protein N7467_008270 [Penicillium canescens]|nr:hypothetical protein N7467_008270 [Penicillium canescens]